MSYISSIPLLALKYDFGMLLHLSEPEPEPHECQCYVQEDKMRIDYLCPTLVPGAQTMEKVCRIINWLPSHGILMEHVYPYDIAMDINSLYPKINICRRNVIRFKTIFSNSQ